MAKDSEQPSEQHDQPLEIPSFGDDLTIIQNLKAETDYSCGDEKTAMVTGEDLDQAYPLTQSVDLQSRYHVEKVLGEGGMGKVLLATDSRLMRRVAIKRLLPGSVRSRTAIRRFLSEAKALAAVSHPNIVQVYDFGSSADGPYLIMEYVEGESLLERVKRSAIPVTEAVGIVSQLCDGLNKAHGLGIIHRDIKPANVLLTSDGTPKLSDFGLAKAESDDAGVTINGAVLGTIDFMSPEQRRDATTADERSDLWSLGATLYQLISGKSPRVIRLDEISQPFRDVLAQVLQEDRALRFQTARQFKEALLSCIPNNFSQPLIPSGLEAGECPGCHATNDSLQKFCRECGESLRCSCLGCNHQIPIWETQCRECGGSQIDLAKKRELELGEFRTQAEAFRGRYAFEDAERLAEMIAGVVDRRVSIHKAWADDFLASIKAEKTRLRELATQSLTDAKKHLEAFDYLAAINLIKTVPEPFRDDRLKSFALKAESDFQESKELLKLISQRIRDRDLEGLLPIVDRAFTLRGNRSDLKKLQTQLKKREKGKTEFESKRDDVRQLRPPLPSLALDADYHQYIKRPWKLLNFDTEDLQAPVPSHPDTLVSECLRLITSSEFTNRFPGTKRRSFHSRFKGCLMKLEKWAFYYIEYRGDFVNLWNQSAAVFKEATIDASYFNQSPLRQKYPFFPSSTQYGGQFDEHPKTSEASQTQTAGANGVVSAESNSKSSVFSVVFYELLPFVTHLLFKPYLKQIQFNLWLLKIPFTSWLLVGLCGLLIFGLLFALLLTAKLFSGGN